MNLKRLRIIRDSRIERLVSVTILPSPYAASSKLKPVTFLILLLILLWNSGLQAQTLGYAFSGGGARGFAHIGVLKVLEEEGIRPDFISGSSIGAIIGAMYAMGYSASEIENICMRIDWDDLTRDIHNRKDLYIGQKRWAPYGNITLELSESWVPQLPSSVYVGNKINLELFRIFAPAAQNKEFSQLPIPFACNATNLITGEAVTFTKGSLMQALRASMSIPSLVLPFEIDGNVYIDGGVSQNLPINLVHDLGATQVIAFKVNSSLRDDERLNNLVEILDQTINIGITRNLNELLGKCDLLIEPDLSDYSARDYPLISQIIALGEQAARAALPAIREFKASLNKDHALPASEFNKDLLRYKVDDIHVVGNKYVSAAKVKEYLGLYQKHTYSTPQIFSACQDAWNSQAFNTIYPVLERVADDSYMLKVHVKERDRKLVALNMTYTSEDNLVAGALLGLNNYLLKNSKLLAEVKLGGKNEINLDYVKNFGEEWGAYYRLFPYVNDKTIYNYVDHHKTNSVNSLEWGITTGLGVFAKDLAIAEFFLYSNQTRLYDEISETPTLARTSVISGFGVKGYHESLDHYVFPSKGARILGKFNFSRNLGISDYIYSSFHGKIEKFIPLYHWLSMGLCLNYGSYFNANSGINQETFYFGGADGFMGYSQYEMSASHYQITSLGLSYRPWKRIALNAGVQGLVFADSEIWGEDKDWEYCLTAGIGLVNNFMPVRLSLALNEARELNSFLSIGYDVDIFRFSRR